MARKVLQARAPKPRKLVNRELVAAASPYLIVNNWDHLIVNDDYVRMEILSEWSSEMRLNWAEPFLGLGGVNAPVSLVMRRRPPEEIRGNLTRSANAANAWDADRIRETFMERREREYEAEQAAKAADLIIKANASIYEVYLYMALHAPNPEELEVRTRTVEGIVKGEHLDCTAHYANQLPMFMAASPFLMDDPVLEQIYNYAAPVTAMTRGLWNREKGIAEPTGIPFGDDGDQGPVRFDIMNTTPDKPNRNVFISAESGSGKSALIKHIITYLATLYDTKILINDVDGEYGALVRKLGGVVVSLNSATGMLLSPFIPRNIGSEASEDSPEHDGLITDEEVREARKEALRAKVLSTHLPFLVSFLMKAFSLSEKEHRNLLHKACERAYDRLGIDSEMSFGEYYSTNNSYPCLADVYDEILEMKRSYPDRARRLDDIALSLERGVSGADKHLWEKTADSIVDAPIVCIDMQGVSADEEMMAAQYYNVLSWEWSQVRGNRYSGKKVVIISDEANRNVCAKNYDSAMMLKDMVQRARKYDASMICATQMITDMLEETVRSAGLGIINNSCFQFFGATSGDLDNKEFDNLRHTQQLLHAPAATMQKLADAERGTFIVRVGKKRESWLHVRLPEWELELFGKGGGK